MGNSGKTVYFEIVAEEVTCIADKDFVRNGKNASC